VRAIRMPVTLRP